MTTGPKQARVPPRHETEWIAAVFAAQVAPLRVAAALPPSPPPPPERDRC